MAKMAILLPNQDMIELAEKMLKEYPQIIRKTVEIIGNDEAAARAKELAADGCDVIMARGLQAKRIKQAVNIPLIELRVSAQEMGVKILELKQELGIACPKIAAIGFDNMLCDTSHFDRLFGVELVRRIIMTDDDYVDAIRTAVEEAAEGGALGIVGGNTSCRRASELGLNCRFISSGPDSMRMAFDMAKHVCYAIDREKSNRAELETVLDNTQSGILRLDQDGCIRLINTEAGILLKRTAKDLLGRKITEVFPSYSEEALGKVLAGEETYMIATPVKYKALVVNTAPVHVEENIDGAIMTLQEGRRVMEMTSELRHELFLRGYMARWRFGDIPAKSVVGQEMLRHARRVSQYSAPVLLVGEAGSGKEILAQAIHNGGITQGGAFIPLDCRAFQSDTLDSLLFGNFSSRREPLSCLADAAQNGTIYLVNIEYLSDELQYKVLRLIRGTFIPNGSNRPVETNVRILAGTQTSLIARVEKGQFRPDLYYALSALSISLQPLRSRREDILDWANLYLNEWKKQYRRVVQLTQSAKSFLASYDWPGNLNQLNGVCEQAVLLSEKRNIDEGFLRSQLEHLTPRVQPETGQVVVYRDEKADRIEALLREYNGNRKMVADALGVSKTTLWRYINKYGIDKGAKK